MRAPLNEVRKTRMSELTASSLYKMSLYGEKYLQDIESRVFARAKSYIAF